MIEELDKIDRALKDDVTVDDGLVDLPSLDAKPAYTEKASHAEMTFAGHYLNLAGLVLLTMGMLSYLRVSGITEAATSGGLLQSCLGAGLGLFLSWSGDRLHRQGQRSYALPLLATGIAILTVTISASHFYFHLLPISGLAVAQFAIVSWAGLAAIRYDSPLIGGCMLAAEFVGPLIMGFPLDGVGVALAYLLAINLATTLVASRKKWDGFLIASLAGSYGLYFHQFGLSAPWSALGFLAMTYGLFLVSGNLFHFLRRSASDFNQGLSLVNPLLFACVSYLVLLQLPNAAALAVYTTVALVHAGLALTAANLRGQGLAYVQMAQANLVLAILFSTAAVSFLTYCSVDTSYFALVTFLWLAQGFAFLIVSRRLKPHFSLLVLRGSYGALALASMQLAFVVPTMQQPHGIEFAGMLALLAYFVLHEAQATTLEQRLFSNLVLLSAVVAGYHSFPFSLFSMPGLLAGAALAPLALLASMRYPVTLIAYRYLSPMLAWTVTGLVLCHPWPRHSESFVLVLLAALLASLTPLCLRRPELDGHKTVGAVLATIILVRACWAVAGLGPIHAQALAVLTLFALYLIMRTMDELETGVKVLGLLLGVPALLLPASLPSELASLASIVALYGLAGAQALSERRWALGGGAAVVAGVLAMRLALLLQIGSGSTLMWCLLGLALLRFGQGADRVALGVMFLAFLKAILFDSNFTIGKSGLELATTMEVGSLLLVGAVIACYAVAANLSQEEPEIRNYYSLFGLLIFAFQTTFMLFHIYGVLDTFQVILSGFWAGASLLFVAYGIHRENKLFRLFGLVVLVSCVVKIYAVDIRILDAYNQTTTTLVLGSLLMLVSFLYQSNRTRLEAPCLA